MCEVSNDSVVTSCDQYDNEDTCPGDSCQWVYNGQGTQFQVLVGPAFIYTFSTAALIFGIALDRFNRPLIMGTGNNKLKLYKTSYKLF